VAFLCVYQGTKRSGLFLILNSAEPKLNQCSPDKCLQALIDSTESLDEEKGVRMVALFDHEEVGSDSAQGAGSPVLVDALRRIAFHFGESSTKVDIMD
jgi:aspartyl aminopeptidase